MLRFPDGTGGESTLTGLDRRSVFEQQKVPGCGAGSRPKPPLEIATGSAFGDS